MVRAIRPPLTSVVPLRAGIPGPGALGSCFRGDFLGRARATTREAYRRHSIANFSGRGVIVLGDSGRTRIGKIAAFLRAGPKRCIIALS